MIHEYRDFYAIQNMMPGAAHPLRVGGVVVFRTSGYTCRLERYEGNPGINPFILNLTLAIEGPDAGQQVLDVLTPCELEEYRIEQPSLEYTHVTFHVDRPDVEPPPSIPVERPV